MNTGLSLITGGTGMVGTHLLLHLVKRCENVRAIKRPSSNIALVKRVFTFYDAVELFSKVEWVDGDINDMASLSEAMIGVDFVYHAAGLVSFDPRDRLMMYKINIEGTANVVNACLLAKVTKLCHVSSTAAIGNVKEGGYSTESTPWIEEEISSNYAISKHYAENEIWRGMAEGLSSVIVNPCIIIGPGDISRSSGKIYQSVKNGLRVYTSGANAVVDVRDVVDVMIVLMHSEIESNRFLLIGENLTFATLFSKVAHSLSLRPPQYRISNFWIEWASRLEKIGTWFTRKSPRLSAESAKSAISSHKYSANKLHDAIQFKFKSIDETTRNAGRFFR